LSLQTQISRWVRRTLTLLTLFVCSIDTGADAAGRHIEVHTALYGNGTFYDVTASVSRICDGQVGCAFKLIPRVLGVSDPAPRKRKKIVINWSCDGRRMPAYEEQEQIVAPADEAKATVADLGC
jgi:hypothetical protein